MGSEVGRNIRFGTDERTTEASSGPLPERATPRDGARHQPWCTADVPTGADRCPTCNVWQPSNTGAWKTGAFSRQLLESQAVVEAMADKRAALKRHVGDASEVQSDLIGDYALVDVLISTVADNILKGGMLTPKGKRRAAVTLLLLLLDRRVKYAGMLGLKAVIKDVDLARALVQETR
jgi:hypothetical protein